ncbi:MAG TPA: ATP-binding protein [Alphaproteobacteria bacterium]|nr:ATP-binding protein [Alphaproteobacteria bacterium]
MISRIPGQMLLLLGLHFLNFGALLVTILAGMWGEEIAWTLPALGFFILTWLLLIPIVIARGIPAGHEERYDKELRQTLTRVLMGSAVEVYAISMLSDSPTVIRPYIAISHLWWGAVLLPITFFFYRPKREFASRLVSALSDNAVFTLILLSNRTYAAGIWPMYLWAALGNGFRFGVRPLLYNLALGVLGFALVVVIKPAWRSMPALTVGLFLAQILLPLYASGLIRRLHEATAAAKKANEAKTRFIAVMSHELRTPLSAMLGTVGLLRNSALSDDQRQLVHLIGGSGQSLLSMINELLDFSAIDSGKVHLDIRDVQVYELLVSTVNTLATAAAEKGLGLQAHVDCRLPRNIRTDSEHVRRIITNLVWNAIKFTKVGRIDVSLSLSPTRERLVIEIQDTGVGIPAEKQAQIFDPFVQGDDRVERAYEGVGLGLAIVRELVSVHRGQISLKSQVGVGSRFTVELPVGLPIAQEAASPEPQTGERVALIAGSGPLAGGGLIDACRGLGLSCSFVDTELGQLRRALEKAKGGLRPLVFLSHRDMSIGSRVSPERFDELVSLIEAERGVPILVLGEGDFDETIDPYRTRAKATIRSATQMQLANALYFADLDTPAHAEASSEDYEAKKRCKLLLVEDNATNRLITGRAMSEAGHEVMAVSSGDEALNALDRGTFDVVIMDINMPGLNGFETTKIIRAINYSEALRIIGLTADVTTETKRRCLEAGMDLVLTKPASVSVMLKAIDDLVTHGVTNVVTEKVTSIEANSRFRARRAPIVDDAGFQRLKEIGGPSFILESVTLFLAEAVDLLGEMEDALNAYDRARAFDIFHSLKGICANVGAMRLRELVNTLRDSDSLISERAQHMAKLREELGVFQTEVSKRIPELQAMPMPFG